MRWKNYARVMCWLAILLILLGAVLLSAQVSPRKPQPPRVSSPVNRTSANPSASRFKGIWEPVSYPDDVQWQDVFFATPQEGWVAGGTNELHGGMIIHTRDGGDNWEVQYGDPQSSERAIKELRFLDRIHGWAVQGTGSASRLLHTRDGQNWMVAGNLDEHHTDYMFTSETTGVQVGGHEIKLTTDGGRSWRIVAECEAKIQVNGLWQNVQCEWRRLQFVTPRVAYAIAKGYGIRTELFLARSNDGGASWSMLTQELTDYPEDIFFLDENTGYVRTGAADTGQIYKTNDAGRTWTGMATSPGNRMQFADPEVGWALRYRKISFTADGGNRWNSREFPFPASADALSLPRRDRGYVAGQHGMIFRYRVVPVEFTAKGAFDAPVMPAYCDPITANLDRIKAKINALQSKLAAAGAPVSAPQGGVSVNDPAAAQGTFNASAASTTAPSGFSQDASVAGTNTGASPDGGFVQDTSFSPEAFNAPTSQPLQDCCAAQVQSLQTEMVSFGQQVPPFSGKFRNLNLLFVGFNMFADLINRAHGIRDSFLALKKAPNLQAAAMALQELSGKLEQTSQAVTTGFQNLTASNVTGGASGAAAGFASNAVTSSPNQAFAQSSQTSGQPVPIQQTTTGLNAVQKAQQKLKIKKFPF